MIAVFTLSQAQSANNINQHQQDSAVNAWKARVIGKPLSPFIAAGDGGIINNDSLKGKLVYINMWEASCAPCMAEMSALNKLYDTLRNYPNFIFVSLSADEIETISRIKAKYKIQYSIERLPEEGCYQLNQGMGYPTSIILDSKGNMIYVHSGGELENDKIWKFIFKDEVYPMILKELN